MAATLSMGGAAISKVNAADNAPLGRRAAFAEKVKEKLGLTDEQGQKIKEEMIAEKDTIVDLMQRFQTARHELSETIEKSSATEADVRLAAGKLAVVEADAAVLRAKLYKKISPILTQEQVGKLKELNGSVDQLLSQVIEKAGTKLRER